MTNPKYYRNAGQASRKLCNLFTHQNVEGTKINLSNRANT